MHSVSRIIPIFAAAFNPHAPLEGGKVMPLYAPAMSAPNKLIEKIEGFTRKYYLNRLIQGVLVGAVLWIVFYLLINGLEYFSWFPPKGRFVLFLFLLAGSAFVLVYHFLIPLVNLIRFRKKMSVEQASVMIGKFFPEIKDKLLNTIQLSNQMEALNSTSAVGPSTGSGTLDSTSSGTSDDNALLAATIEQRSARLSPIRFSDAVDLRGNLKYLGIFFGSLLILIALMVFLPSFAVQPTQRIVNYEQHFEKPLPYQVEIEQDDIETTQGKEVKFNIRVTGDRIPDAFYVKSELGQQLMTKGSANDFSYTFKNLFRCTPTPPYSPTAASCAIRLISIAPTKPWMPRRDSSSRKAPNSPLASPPATPSRCLSPATH